MEGKDSFILYTKYINTFKLLSDKQAGVLIKHIFNYVNDLLPEEKEDQLEGPVLQIAWANIKADLKDDLKRWKNICKRNQENGSKGGRPKKEETQKNPKNPLGILENPKKPKKADNDSDSEYDNELKENNIKEKASAFKTPTIEEIKAYCQERKNLVDPERFFNFYESKGWMVGKNKMKDWKAAIRTWEKDAGFKDDIPDENGKINGFTVL